LAPSFSAARAHPLRRAVRACGAALLGSASSRVLRFALRARWRSLGGLRACPQHAAYGWRLVQRARMASRHLRLYVWRGARVTLSQRCAQVPRDRAAYHRSVARAFAPRKLASRTSINLRGT